MSFPSDDVGTEFDWFSEVCGLTSITMITVCWPVPVLGWKPTQIESLTEACHEALVFGPELS